jgi:TolA-binding protein
MMSHLRLFFLCVALPGLAAAAEPAHAANTPPLPATEATALAPAPDAPPAMPAGMVATESSVKVTLPTEDNAKLGPMAARRQRATEEQAQIASLIRLGAAKTEEGDLESAGIAYRQLFTMLLTSEQQRNMFIGFARMLRKKGDLIKAAAVYEKVLRDYPLDEDAPELYLELGRTQRTLGAYKSAIDRFYSVITSTVKLPESGAGRYRQLAKTAQFEIAETLFIAGSFQEASRKYAQVRRLDLSPADQGRAYFKSAYSLSLAGDHANAITSLRSFLELYPEDENVPEAHYLLAISYRKLNRPLEALVEALELLRTEKTRTDKDPKRWVYWQRRTGNQIANEFYEQGDTANALTIYQTLSELSPEPTWRLPVTYQIGLCHERLGETERARADYQSILDNVHSAKGDDTARPELADIARMAEWRISQISWQQNTEQRLSSLIPQQRTAQVAPDSRHDASGNPPAAPTALR